MLQERMHSRGDVGQYAAELGPPAYLGPAVQGRLQAHRRREPPSDRARQPGACVIPASRDLREVDDRFLYPGAWRKLSRMGGLRDPVRAVDQSTPDGLGMAVVRHRYMDDAARPVGQPGQFRSGVMAKCRSGTRTEHGRPQFGISSGHSAERGVDAAVQGAPSRRPYPPVNGFVIEAIAHHLNARDDSGLTIQQIKPLSGRSISHAVQADVPLSTCFNRSPPPCGRRSISTGHLDRFT